MSRARTGGPAGAVQRGLPLYGDPFFGREREVEDVCRMLVEGPARLVTLTGPPGIGKTRLAVATAAACVERGHGGASFADLAPITDPDAVLGEVARALGVQPRGPADVVDQIADVIGAAERLVVLDNCEHVLNGVAEIGRLVQVCPELRILATSRERIRLSSEWEFPVPPLPMPARGDAADLAALARVPSIALLVDRARRTNPRFELDAANATALTTACLELEGLPLALELAAARLKLLTPGELAFRLGRRLDVLSGGTRDVPARQRALRAAIAWSYDLLTSHERMLFRRLAVFAGSWTDDDARAVCSEGDDPSALTESLLEKNLVRRVPGDGEQPAFAMLASLREFAAERLAEAGETARVRARHAAHFAALAERLEAAIGVPEERLFWSTGIRHEQDLEAALEYCHEQEQPAHALWLVSALGWCWYTRGDLARAPAVLGDVLAWTAALDDTPDDAARAAAMLVAGIIAFGRGRLDDAELHLRETLQLAAHADDGRRSAVAYAFLGHVARTRGSYEQAKACHDRAAATFGRLDNPQGVAWAHHDLGLLARDRGEPGEAATLFRASLRDFRELDYTWAAAWSAWGLGTALCDQGAVAEARPVLGDALQAYRELDDVRGIAQCFEALAQVAADGAGYESASLLLGSAAVQRVRLAAPLAEAERARIAVVEQAVARGVGADAFERLRQTGRTLPLEQALAVAFDVARGRLLAGQTRPAPEIALTRRERQVVALVAAGNTNRQIGRALGISEKTTEVHLHNAMGKLGARSRAEVAVWAAAQGND